MAFQVVFNTVQIGLPPVILISAGEDKNIACGGIVNLQGVVDIPGNLPGHVILWEQLSGQPIVLSSTNTLSTSYAFSERTDKSFRLWIDKGNPTQQFKDVLIFHTPTSSINMRLSDSQTRVLPPTADVVVCNTILGNLTFSISDPTQGQQDRTPCEASPPGPPTQGINFDFFVSWIVPNTKTEIIPNFIESELYYFDTGLPVPNANYPNTVGSPPVSAYPPGSTITHTFVDTGDEELKRYYVVTRYNVNNEIITGQSCTVDFTGTSIPAIHAIDDIMVMGLSDSKTNIISFENVLRSGESSTTLPLSDSITDIVNFNNIIASGNSSTTTAFSDSTINITRFDQSGIGS